MNSVSYKTSRTKDASELMLELFVEGLVDDHVGDIILGQDRFIEDVRSRGGQGFLERVEKYARTDQGKPVLLRQWYRQTLLLAGDWRIPYVAISGAAQTGKSLAMILAYTDLLIIGRLPFGFAYASRDALDRFSSTQFRPVINHYLDSLEAIGIKLRSRTDRHTNELYQVGGINANYSFASTSKTTASNEGKAIIAGTGASYAAASVCHDERSRFPFGVEFSARAGNSPIPNKPIRDSGTRGGGAGIEVFLDKCDRVFTQHYHCSNCGVVAPLDVLGCLLVETEAIDAFGRKTVDYFGEDGRPRDWWHTDAEKPIKSAAVCCFKCGTPLGFKERVINADMRCKLTGVPLVDYLNSVTGYDWEEKVGIDLSPLCRENSDNIASTLIDKCLTAESPAVVMQEDLGIVSVSKSNRLSMHMLRPLIGAKYPDGDELLWRTVAGLDVGRSSHWLWIQRIFARIDWPRMTWDQFRQTSIRQVLYGGKVHVDLIEEMLDKYQVDFGLVDSYPEVTWAAELCENTCLTLAAQGNSLDDFSRGKVRSGGAEFECWKISNPIMLRSVMNAATRPTSFDGKPPYRFPKAWSRYDGILNESSVFRHLMAVSFDGTEQKWSRPQDKIDDLYFAAGFCNMAMAVEFDAGARWNEVEY